MTKKPYTTTEEIKQAFIKDGWSKNTSFTELTVEEAEKRGMIYAVNEIKQGRKYFKMNVSGNIFNDRGKLILFGFGK